MLMSGLKLLDNRVGLMVNGDKTMIRDSLFVGETDNIGFPLTNRGHTRSHVNIGSDTTLIIGHQPYDNGGPQYSVRNKFVNFINTPERPAGGLGALHNGPFILDTRNKLWGLTFENANAVRLKYNSRDADYGYTVMDMDGSVTGKKTPAWIVSDKNPPLLNSDCEKRPDWEAWICPVFREGYAQFTIKGRQEPTGSVDGQDYGAYGVARWARAEWYRTDLDAGQVYKGQGWESGGEWQDMTNFIPGKVWGIKWLKSPYDANDHSPKNILLRMTSALPGDWVVLALPYKSGTTFDISSKPYSSSSTSVYWEKVDHFYQIEYGKYYYDDSSQHVYIPIVNERTNYDYNYDYVDYDNAGDYIYLSANCGGNCASVGNYAKAFPPLSWLNIDRYKTELVSCAVGAIEDTEGRGWIELDKDTKRISYRIYHSLVDRVKEGYFAFGPEDSLTRVETLPVPPPTAPIAGILTLSSDQWEQLAAGNLFFVLTTEQYPTGALVGKFGCEGTCSPPSPRPKIDDPCSSPSSTVLNIFTDDYGAAWRGDCYDCLSDLVTFDSTLCGPALKTSGSHQWDRMVFYPQYTKEHGSLLPITPSLYKYLEFYIRLAPGGGRTKDTTVAIQTEELDAEWIYLKVSHHYSFL